MTTTGEVHAPGGRAVRGAAASPLGRLGWWSFRHRRLVAAGWVLVLVVMTVAGRLAGSAFSTDLTGGSTQSQQAASFLRENFPAQAGDNPRYTGRQVWNRQRYDVQRWNLPDGWVISARPAHPALVSEADFSAAQDISAARGPAPSTGLAAPRRRIYLLAGLLVCGVCGRRMESAWSNGKPAYRCRYGHTSAASPDPGRSPNAYIREDRLLTHLPALYLLLAGAQSAGGRARRRTRRGADVRPAASPDEVIGYLRDHQVILTWDPAAGTLQAGTTGATLTVTGEAS